MCARAKTNLQYVVSPTPKLGVWTVSPYCTFEFISHELATNSEMVGEKEQEVESEKKLNNVGEFSESS